jgi:pyroglutamyl-peptidase
MKRVLITGFEPFGGETINPSFEAIKNLDIPNIDAHVYTLLVPTLFDVSSKHVIEHIKKINPNIIILVGQAGGRKSISIERVAINIDDSKTPDNQGVAPTDKVINPSGLNAYFSSLPIKSIIQELEKNEIPASVSNSAGTYVCNHLMYSVLDYLYHSRLSKVKAGFIHVPYIDEQVIDKPNQFSMDVKLITKALEIIIKTSLKS